MRKLVLSTAAAVLLAACGTTPENQNPATAPGGASSAAPGVSAPGASVQPVTAGAVDSDPLKDARNVLSKRTVYFDFDSDAIRPEFAPVVEAHAKYLHDHRTAKMLIQGSADERGSREYNLALGQRRADALRQRLTLLGATSPQIETVSLGEEKPVCMAQTEDCWSKNRRDDMLYAGRGEY